MVNHARGQITFLSSEDLLCDVFAAFDLDVAAHDLPEVTHLLSDLEANRTVGSGSVFREQPLDVDPEDLFILWVKVSTFHPK